MSMRDKLRKATKKLLEDELASYRKELFEEGIDILNAEFCASCILKRNPDDKEVQKRIRKVRTAYVKSIFNAMQDSGDIGPKLSQVVCARNFLRDNLADPCIPNEIAIFDAFIQVEEYHRPLCICLLPWQQPSPSHFQSLLCSQLWSYSFLRTSP